MKIKQLPKIIARFRHYCPIGKWKNAQQIARLLPPKLRKVIAITRKLYNPCVRCFVPQHDKTRVNQKQDYHFPTHFPACPDSYRESGNNREMPKEMCIVNQQVIKIHFPITALLPDREMEKKKVIEHLQKKYGTLSRAPYKEYE